MKIGFLVNDVMTEETGFTTTRLGCEAVNQGHDVFVFGVGDLAYDPDERIRARTRAVKKKAYKSHEGYLADLQGGKNGIRERITVDDLDVLVLRNVPSDDYLKRPWASTIAAEFGRLAMRHGVIVVNDPNGLAKASTKMYFQLFPEEVRPQTLITRDRDEIKAFANAQGRNRAQAAARFGWGECLPGPAERSAQSESDDRRRQPRWVRDRTGIPAGGGRRRHAAVRHERPAAAGEGKVRRFPPRAERRATCVATFMRVADWRRPTWTTRPCGLPRSCGRNWCRTACSWSGWMWWETS